VIRLARGFHPDPGKLVSDLPTASAKSKGSSIPEADIESGTWDLVGGLRFHVRHI
jgi:hypothetical protein